jgi:hypothetical protein
VHEDCHVYDDRKTDCSVFVSVLLQYFLILQSLVKLLHKTTSYRRLCEAVKLAVEESQRFVLNLFHSVRINKFAPTQLCDMKHKSCSSRTLYSYTIKVVNGIFLHIPYLILKQ